MCGIFGVLNKYPSSYNKLEEIIAKLLNLSSSRGKEASGLLTINNNDEIVLLKSGIVGEDLLISEEYQSFLSKSRDSEVLAVIGHSRLATHGSQNDNDNNQPLITEDLSYVLVHNGIITNPEVLWKNTYPHLELPSLDSKVLLEYLSVYSKQYGISKAIKMLDNIIEGSASFALVDLATQSVFIYTNTGSLYYCVDTQTSRIYFASEKIFLDEIIASFTLQTEEIKKLQPRNFLCFQEGKIVSEEEFNSDSLEYPKKLPKTTNEFRKIEVQWKNIDSPTLKFVNSIQQLKTHSIDFNRIMNQKRCSKCLLPISTPFISFDSFGVCNFCNDHTPILYKGKATLEEKLEKYRSKDGSPDCIAAFSGGRDSSYGLHYLKKELGMNPMAYTYDWGMVTDLARRNQARMLGQLGVEHLLLSADISKKREHIRKNILAWMKDPHLGMVPLFMQGDKQCEFYADQLMKKYNIKLMFFFRGNEFEKEEFKNGHCGIKDADPGGVIHYLPTKDKLKLLSFYGWRYLKNPAYFNSSFWDTSLAYFSTYIQQHDYLYLWHYIPWKEDLINQTLVNEYNWEKSSETSQMWRTDDGSSAFYNYIYCQVQGFTENDSFRSRQIREGVLTRKEAFDLVMEENQPRYESLKWYFDHLDMNGSEVLDVVDKMPKLY
ncbi:MAG: hypothetical protein M9958_00810 [Chitinophagales bacterium]|nr:hypothetical protein [Chitinophagales bacterium]